VDVLHLVRVRASRRILSSWYSMLCTVTATTPGSSCWRRSPGCRISVRVSSCTLAVAGRSLNFAVQIALAGFLHATVCLADSWLLGSVHIGASLVRDLRLVETSRLHQSAFCWKHEWVPSPLDHGSMFANLLCLCLFNVMSK
jgi:hypothetical protein